MSTLIFAIVSVIYSLTATSIYKSNSVLQIKSNNSSNSSMLANLPFASLSSFGMSFGDDLNIYFAIETIKSREFFKEISEKHNLYPDVHAAKGFYNNKMIYKDYLFKEDVGWVNATEKDFGFSFQEAYESYRKSLFLTEDAKTGFLKLGYEHYSPFFAQRICEIIIDELNEIARNKKIKEVDDALSFLNTEISKSRNISVQASIANLIEAQLSEKTIAKVNKSYLLKPIDKPNFPERREWPKRFQIVIIGTLLGFILTIFTFLTIHTYGKKLRELFNSNE